MSEIPSKNRKIVVERHNNQCARCGCRGSQIHHRQRRREAGHAVGILVWLCAKCHRWAHAHPMDAKVYGYIIPPWETDATALPLKSFMGWVTFDNEGGISFVSAPES